MTFEQMVDANPFLQPNPPLNVSRVDLFEVLMQDFKEFTDGLDVLEVKP